MASLVAQAVKNLPAMWETWVWSLGWEDPLEEGMATHSNILAWRIPMGRSLEGYSPWGHRVRYDWMAKHSTRENAKNSEMTFWDMFDVLSWDIKGANFFVLLFFLPLPVCFFPSFKNY